MPTNYDTQSKKYVPALSFIRKVMPAIVSNIQHQVDKKHAFGVILSQNAQKEAMLLMQHDRKFAYCLSLEETLELKQIIRDEIILNQANITEQEKTDLNDWVNEINDTKETIASHEQKVYEIPTCSPKFQESLKKVVEAFYALNENDQVIANSIVANCNGPDHEMVNIFDRLIAHPELSKNPAFVTALNSLKGEFTNGGGFPTTDDVANVLVQAIVPKPPSSG